MNDILDFLKEEKEKNKRRDKKDLEKIEEFLKSMYVFDYKITEYCIMFEIKDCKFTILFDGCYSYRGETKDRLFPFPFNTINLNVGELIYRLRMEIIIIRESNIIDVINDLGKI